VSLGESAEGNARGGLDGRGLEAGKKEVEGCRSENWVFRCIALIYLSISTAGISNKLTVNNDQHKNNKNKFKSS